VLAIDTDRRKLAVLPCRTLAGNAEYGSVLGEARLSSARLLVSTLHIEETNSFLAFRCRELGIPCSIHAFDESVVKVLTDLDVDHLMFSKNEGIRLIIRALRERGVLPA
jgi:Trk K+ transport system NAD-binding subunit